MLVLVGVRHLVRKVSSSNQELRVENMISMFSGYSSTVVMSLLNFLRKMAWSNPSTFWSAPVLTTMPALVRLSTNRDRSLRTFSVSGSLMVFLLFLLGGKDTSAATLWLLLGIN